MEGGHFWLVFLGVLAEEGGGVVNRARYREGTGFGFHAADAWEGVPSPATPPKSILINVTFGD